MILNKAVTVLRASPGDEPGEASKKYLNKIIIREIRGEMKKKEQTNEGKKNIRKKNGKI